MSIREGIVGQVNTHKNNTPVNTEVLWGGRGDD